MFNDLINFFGIIGGECWNRTNPYISTRRFSKPFHLPHWSLSKLAEGERLELPNPLQATVFRTVDLPISLTFHFR